MSKGGVTRRIGANVVTRGSEQSGLQSNRYSVSANLGNSDCGNTLTPSGIIPTPKAATPIPERSAALSVVMLALSNRTDQRILFSRNVRRIISRDAEGAGYNTSGTTSSAPLKAFG